MKLDDEKPLVLRRILKTARGAKGWSMQQLASRATHCLRSAHETRPGTTEELALWSSLVLSVAQVNAFEDYHKSPLGSPEKTAQLLGVTLALELDPADVNRAAGGV